MKQVAQVYIIGTSHYFQIPGKRRPEETRAFNSLLQSMSDQYQVHAIAEEMNLERLSREGQQESTCKKVADKLGLIHRYCDPTSETRKKLGMIIDESDIHLQKLWSGLSEEQVNRKIRDEHKKREQYWLKELQDLEVFPVLFICGANHALSFADVVSQGGLPSEVLYENWSS
jgi:hypothetical protein